MFSAMDQAVKSVIVLTMSSPGKVFTKDTSKISCNKAELNISLPVDLGGF